MVQPPATPATEAEHCANCGAVLTTPFCGACGQKRAERLGWRTVKDEAWDKLRFYENSVVKSALLTLANPGKVAREFVDGARKKHQHPLKLLLLAIGILVLVIVETKYFDAANPDIPRIMQVVRSYSQWSFSLGLVAVLVASLMAFFRAARTNLVEQLALAMYTHFAIITLSILWLAPLLIWRSPEAIAWHKSIPPLIKDSLEAMIVGYAFFNFYRIDWRQNWWRLLAAIVLYYATKKALLYLYAHTIVHLVIEQWI